MQQDSNKKKGKGYRVRPASARERLNGRTRRVCTASPVELPITKVILE